MLKSDRPLRLLPPRVFIIDVLCACVCSSLWWESFFEKKDLKKLCTTRVWAVALAHSTRVNTL